MPAVMTDTRVGNGLDWIRSIDFPEWYSDGLCGQQIDLPFDAWHPVAGPGRYGARKAAAAEPAKEVCAECPVRTKCLEYALETDQRHGVWGGLDEHERRELKRRRSA
jgi:hypothetical protein